MHPSSGEPDAIYDDPPHDPGGDPDDGSPILSPGDLAELERLRRHLGLRTATDGPGARASRRRGESSEFVDHRAYHPGDDLRRLDWNVLARSDLTVIKRYRAEEESAVRIAVDTSGSMGTGAPSKWKLAQRLAAAIGYVALADGARVQMAELSQRGATLSPAKRGRSQFGAILNHVVRCQVDSVSPSLLLAPEIALADFLSRCGRPGVLVVITDALAANGDLEAWPRALARASSSGHTVRLIQVLSPQDIDPPWDGDLELVDAESGARLDVTFDATARASYAQHLETLVSSLREGCRRSKASCLRVRTDELLLPAVRRFASGGID